ncbi:hypothetical protein ASPU41_03270 [Arthrobacter sp. U41]|nr:hypothetical protein [Arthrobacter sp. U41]AOT02513.1 hypothetical protein ASPU41_03270 [Arthrobacter sp. U41]
MDPGRVILIAGMIGLLALVMMLLAVLSRRILGVRVGPARTILALVVAVVAEFLFESQVLWQIPDRGLAFISLQFGIALFAAFLFLVVAELVLPRGVLPPPHTWLPALRAGSQRGIRYAQILRIGARHGLFPLRTSNDPDANARRADSLRLALEEAGVTFVKFGPRRPIPPLRGNPSGRRVNRTGPPRHPAQRIPGCRQSPTPPHPAQGSP